MNKLAQRPAFAPVQGRKGAAKPTPSQRRWLKRGLRQAGGKLPLFDETGRRVNERTVRSCIENGWAEPWFANPIKPDWLVCKLTEAGRSLLSHVRFQGTGQSFPSTGLAGVDVSV
ncbi:MAG TPA: hypothetical protein QF556_11445 [Rhodospirillales bacterium]|nr:hypothetical protein [Rhodospirillales bacterium]